MSPHGLGEAFAVKVQRAATDDRGVTTLLQAHFGEVDISPKQIKSFLHGTYFGAFAAYVEAMGLYSPSSSALEKMAFILKKAMGNVEDIAALTVFQEAIEVYDRERAEQLNRHTAIYAIRVEQKWGVPERLFLKGDTPTEDDLVKIAQFGIDHHQMLLSMLGAFGPEAARKMMTPGNTEQFQPRENPPEKILAAEFSHFVIESARLDYAYMFEEASKAYEPAPGTQVDAALGDFMSRFTKGGNDGPVT